MAQKEGVKLPTVGAKLQAKFSDGEWYNAEVIAVSESKKRAKMPIKVHFVDFPPEDDCWMSPADVKKGKAKKKPTKAGKGAAPADKPTKAPAKPVLAPGAQVKAKFSGDGKWYDAEVIAVSESKKKVKAPVKVHYVGFGKEEDEFRSFDDVKASGSRKPGKAAGAAEPGKAAGAAEKPAVGTKVIAKFSGDGKTYKAEVVAVSTNKKRSSAPIKVHYVDFPPEEDEWRSLEDIKVPKGKKAPAAAPAAPAPAAGDFPSKGSACKAKFAGDGKFYFAEVVHVSRKGKRKNTPFLVKYNDFNEQAWLAEADVKPAKKGKGKGQTAAPAAPAPAKAEAPALPEVGTKGTAKFSQDGKFYKAEVVAVSKNKKRKAAPVKVHYVDFGADEDEWRALEDLKMKLPKGKKQQQAPDKKGAAPAPAATKAGAKELPEKGTKLKARFGDGVWYPAEVIAVAKKPKNPQTPVKVHYEGFDPKEDEWKSLEDLSLKKPKKQKPKKPKAATGSS